MVRIEKSKLASIKVELDTVVNQTVHSQNSHDGPAEDLPEETKIPPCDPIGCPQQRLSQVKGWGFETGYGFLCPIDPVFKQSRANWFAQLCNDGLVKNRKCRPGVHHKE